jgi:hypothetical protein
VDTKYDALKARDASDLARDGMGHAKSASK